MQENTNIITININNIRSNEPQTNNIRSNDPQADRKQQQYTEKVILHIASSSDILRNSIMFVSGVIIYLQDALYNETTKNFNYLLALFMFLALSLPIYVFSVSRSICLVDKNPHKVISISKMEKLSRVLNNTIVVTLSTVLILAICKIPSDSINGLLLLALFAITWIIIKTHYDIEQIK
jgi:hypothetical protein